MGKKKKVNALEYVYLIGMALSVIGFCCPMFNGLMKSTYNGFKFIDFDNSGFVTTGALLLFVGAVAGTCFGVLPLLKIKLPSAKLLKLVAVVVVLVGAIVLVVGFTNNGGVYKFIGKQLFKHATYGFYMVIAGWVVGAAGWFLEK